MKMKTIKAILIAICCMMPTSNAIGADDLVIETTKKEVTQIEPLDDYQLDDDKFKALNDNEIDLLESFLEKMVCFYNEVNDIGIEQEIPLYEYDDFFGEESRELSALLEEYGFTSEKTDYLIDAWGVNFQLSSVMLDSKVTGIVMSLDEPEDDQPVLFHIDLESWISFGNKLSEAIDFYYG